MVDDDVREALRGVATVATDAARSVTGAMATASARPIPRRPWPLQLRGGRSGRRRDLVWVGDVVLAIVIASLTAVLHQGDPGQVPSDPSSAPLVAAAVSMFLPVALRDRRPLLAWRIGIVLVALSAWLMGIAGIHGPVAPTHVVVLVVTSWTAVQRADRPVAVGVWLVTMAGLAAVPAVAVGGQAALTPQGWLWAVVGLSAPIVLAASVRRQRRVEAELATANRHREEERAERAVLQERARIARELHDVVAHHMSLVAIQAEAAPLRSPQDPAALVADLGSIRASARSALDETRRILGVLRAEDGEGVTPPQPGLDRVTDLVDAARAAGHPVDVDLHVTTDPPPGVALSIYRIIQESCNNVRIHAPGAPIRISARSLDDPAALEVRVTNGPPARPATPEPGQVGGGHGVVGMRERVAMLGGTLAVGPTADGGHEVAVTIPLDTDRVERRSPQGLPETP